jgi:hypothetical protein
MSGYMLYMYTEWVWELETRYLVGWIHCGILGVNLIINISFMIYASSHGIKMKCKRRYLLKQHKKQMA